MDVAARAALCQADTQYGLRLAFVAFFWSAALTSSVVPNPQCAKDFTYPERPIIAQDECAGISSEIHGMSLSNVE